MTQHATYKPSCVPLNLAWERQRNVIVRQLWYVSMIVNETGITGVSGACAVVCCWIRSVLHDGGHALCRAILFVEEGACLKALNKSCCPHSAEVCWSCTSHT